VPELPEVETVARQLAPRIVGRAVERLVILDPLLRAGRTPRLAGRRVVGVSRSGKRVLIEFAPVPRGRGGLWLAVHLRMTGRLLWVTGAARPVLPHLRARFELRGGSLLFVDTRRFGTFDWHVDRRAARPAGLDPLAPELSARRLSELLAGSRQNVKAWLLRQDRLVGLGNIYASEILHAAGISPLRSACSLEAGEIARLHRSIRRILRDAIRSCGTTFSDFQDARGIEGSYQRFLAVYDRAGEGCPRCRGKIDRLVQQQRSTFYCPGCQG
jgi:formamidopyrimidine-DNA glycosylase